LELELEESDLEESSAAEMVGFSSQIVSRSNLSTTKIGVVREAKPGEESQSSSYEGDSIDEEEEKAATYHHSKRNSSQESSEEEEKKESQQEV
jgi:hypothetical protein